MMSLLMTAVMGENLKRIPCDSTSWQNSFSSASKIQGRIRRTCQVIRLLAVQGKTGNAEGRTGLTKEFF
jgi:hypothetical protein